MSEPLTDQLDLPAEVADQAADPSPADGGTGSEEAAAAPDYAALQATIDEQNRKMEELSKRFTDTQAWAHQLSAQAAQKQAYLEAIEQSEAARRQQQEYWASMQPPSFSDDEKQAVLEDPALLEKKMKELVTYGYRYAVATFEQPVRQALAAAQVTGRLAMRERARTEKEAREMAKEHGIQAEEFDALIPHVRGAFDAMPDQGAAESLRLDPEMVVNAVNVIRNRGGVPLKKQKAPASLSPGSHHGGTPPSLADLRSDPSIQKLRDEFGGLTLSPESLQKFEARRRAANRR